MRWSRRRCLACFLSLCAARLVAQEHPPEPGLPTGDDALARSLIAEALERNPDIRVAEALVHEAAARPPQARALSEPMFSVLYTNEGGSPSLGANEFTTLGLLWSQDLPWPGKRGLRGELARLGARIAEQQLARARLSLTAEVRRAYHELIHARELLGLLREQQQVSRALAEATRDRYAIGQGTEVDVLRAQVELTRLEMLSIQRGAEEAVRLAALNRLRARGLQEPLATSAHPALMPLSRSPEELATEIQAASPELQAAAVGVEQDQTARLLARTGGKPDWNLAVGYQNRGGLPGMWQAGVGLRLPVYRSKLQAGITEAEARLGSSKQRVESLRLLLQLRTEERVFRARAIEQTAALYARALLPQDRLLYDSALANYATGRVALVSVLEALLTLFRDREAELRLVADHQILMADLAEASLAPGAGMSDTPAR